MTKRVNFVRDWSRDPYLRSQASVGCRIPAATGPGQL